LSRNFKAISSANFLVSSPSGQKPDDMARDNEEGYDHRQQPTTTRISVRVAVSANNASAERLFVGLFAHHELLFRFVTTRFPNPVYGSRLRYTHRGFEIRWVDRPVVSPYMDAKRRSSKVPTRYVAREDRLVIRDWLIL